MVTGKLHNIEASTHALLHPTAPSHPHLRSTHSNTKKAVPRHTTTFEYSAFTTDDASGWMASSPVNITATAITTDPYPNDLCSTSHA